MSIGCPVLTYHSQLVFGRDYGNNSHTALQEDLRVIAGSGRRLVALPALVEACLAGRNVDYARIACIAFDDGPDFDWLDHLHPSFGFQPAFASLLRRHAESTRRWAGATSFVLASPQARRRIGYRELGGDRMRDDWWRAAQDSGVLSIECHGWDHRHPAADPNARASFHDVADEASCFDQIDRACDYIAGRTGRRPVLFAYPYGESSPYLRDVYLPARCERHGLMAAFGIEAGMLHARAPRWNLPRLVHAQHWSTPDELRARLRD